MHSASNLDNDLNGTQCKQDDLGQVAYLAHFGRPFIFCEDPARKVRCEQHASCADCEDKQDDRRGFCPNIEHEQECENGEQVVHSPI